MVDNASHFDAGAMVRSEEYKKLLALNSLRHCSGDDQFGELFPELKQETDEKLAANPDKYEAANNKLLAFEDIMAWLFYIGIVVLVVLVLVAFGYVIP